MRRRRVVVGLFAAALVAGFAASASPEGQKAPRIRVEPEAFDFGKALPAKTLRKEFTLSAAARRRSPRTPGSRRAARRSCA